ncbi:MAG: GIY-YIG nuclease family protein [Oligoflexus sp.]|nr:GIY-YIG nuclease family protein [Oligoflexus sp.]
MEVWFVYLIRCTNDSLYCGITKDPEKRFKSHVSGKGARYTRIYAPLELVYREGPFTHGDALRRERQIKLLPRIIKSQLVLSYSETSRDMP